MSSMWHMGIDHPTNLQLTALRYRTYTRQYPVQCFQDVSANFLYGFLCWVCDRRRGKGGRRRPGIKRTSSLETFWKWYLMVYRSETGKKMDGMVQVQGFDVRSPVSFGTLSFCWVLLLTSL